ncbi:hypothetical protein [Corallococcus silvisoli]|nr:hypothetical protein [Corallococcus silvisoli]NBD12002.1 hypothetical protein [Corallococcus silvisoli]
MDRGLRDISATPAAHLFEPGKPVAYLLREGACAATMNALIEKHVKQRK